MSLIFDALKKAESERNRNSGPVLMDVRIAPRRQQLPIWAWVLGCVLLVNLLFLAWLLLRPDAAPPAITTVATPPVAAPPPVAPAPVAPPPAAPLPAMQPIAAPVTTAAPPAPPPASSAAPVKPPATRIATQLPGVDDLPTMRDLLASGVALPTLQLSLHVYDEVPGNRYVLLNSRRLREGEALSDDIKVELITPRGVVLDAGGRRFLLIAGG